MLICTCPLMYYQNGIPRFIQLGYINVTEANELRCSNCNEVLSKQSQSKSYKQLSLFISVPTVHELPPAAQDVTINIFSLDVSEPDIDDE